LIASARQ
jgi:hypothetical protein